MKVSLEFAPPVGKSGKFTTQEHVRGLVRLNVLNSEVVSRVVLSLEGRIEAACGSKSVWGSLPVAADCHELFKICQIVFPTTPISNKTNGFTLPKGTHTFPFDFQFPVLSSCCQPSIPSAHLMTTLPPSFTFRAPKLSGSASVRYWLRVKVQHPDQFKRALSWQKELPFLPLDPILPPPMFEPAIYTRGRLVSLNVTLPSPAVLHVDSTLPLQVCLKSQERSAEEPPAIFHSLQLAIRTHTRIVVGTDSGTWQSNQCLLECSKLDLQLPTSSHDDVSSREVDAGLWEDVTVPNMTPSFTTCTVSQQHSLVVTTRFSYGRRGSIQTLEAIVNVEVHSNTGTTMGLVAFGEEDTSVIDEFADLIPWRIGTERHLGITRGSVSSLDRFEAPPPYA